MGHLSQGKHGTDLLLLRPERRMVHPDAPVRPLPAVVPRQVRRLPPVPPLLRRPFLRVRLLDLQSRQGVPAQARTEMGRPRSPNVVQSHRLQ